MRGKETRAGVREAVAECSSSRTLGEYAVSARSDIRSTASLQMHQPRKSAGLYRAGGEKDYEESRTNLAKVQVYIAQAARRIMRKPTTESASGTCEKNTKPKSAVKTTLV